MKKLVALLAAGAVCALALAALSTAAAPATVWETTLTAKAEVPPQVVKNTKASGTFKGTLKVQPTPNPNFRRVDAIVANADDREMLTISTVMSH